MANHGKVGVELEQYRARKSKERRRYVPDPKTRKYTTQLVKGRYQKASYLKRAEKRAAKSSR